MNVRKSKNRVFDLMPKFYSFTEVKNIFEQITQGDEIAMENLIRNYEPFIDFIIERFFFETDLPKEELYEEGMIGLAKAIKHFNMKNGKNFDYYVYRCIKNEILRFINKEKYAYLVNCNKDLTLHNMGKKVTSCEEVYLIKDNREILLTALDILPTKRKEILKLKFGLIDEELLSNPNILKTLSHKEILEIMENGQIDRQYTYSEISQIYGNALSYIEQNVRYSLEILRLHMKNEKNNKRYKTFIKRRK